MSFRVVTSAIVAILIYGPASSGATLWLPHVFGDHMVLQQDQRIPVWGKASPDEGVRVTLGSRSERTRAGDDGRWIMRLREVPAGGPYAMTVTAGGESKTFSDVLVGEVWVCSGQSNMQWSVRDTRNAEKEMAGADFPNLRLFYVERSTAGAPQADCNAAWTTTTPETVADFSAVAYFFGRELYTRRKVPVGLIHTSWGGTPAEAWMSRPALEAGPKFAPILARSDEVSRTYPLLRAEWEKAHAAWERDRDKAAAQGGPAPEEPKELPVLEDQYRPTFLYNAMIAPIAPYGIRGAIWYQGESNAGRAYQYRSLFPAMIENWRATWGQGDFPFVFVQIANYLERKTEPGESSWAELREAQMMTLSLRNTGMAVTIDIGDAVDIHPKNKQDVGQRLWYAAERVAYGNRATEESGPLFAAVTYSGGEARVRFDNARLGLKTMNNAPVKGFAIAGADYKFVWADARIAGDSVVVSSPAVPRPVAVRYGWADNPECTLYSGAGLPASPFRTDTRPGVTIANE